MTDVVQYRKDFMSKFRPAADFRKKYNLEATPIGTGHFSKVYKAHSSNRSVKDLYAVKKIDMLKLEEITEIQALDNEISVLQTVEHPGIIKLYDVYSDANEVWLVLEFLQGGDLFSRIIQRSEDNNYTEYEAAKIIRHILEILDYLHEKKIVHRDLKPENVLMRDEGSETRLKLADFGFAAFCNIPLDDPYGTPVYVAPEVLVGEAYTTTPDMWSLGVIAYILLCGYPPFFNNDQEVLARMIVRTGFKFLPEDWSMVSDDAKNFIRGLLRKNPRKRFTAKEALNQPWILNYGYAVTSVNVNKYLTINEELRKFKATLNIQKAFGVLRAFEKMKKLTEMKNLRQSVNASKISINDLPETQDNSDKDLAAKRSVGRSKKPGQSQRKINGRKGSFGMGNVKNNVMNAVNRVKKVSDVFTRKNSSNI